MTTRAREAAAARAVRRGVACAFVAALGACKSIEGPSPVLIPNRALEVSRSLAIPADTILLAAGLFLIVDPLAPNWHIEQRDLGSGRYAFALTKKRFGTGGDGESLQVLRRQVERIAFERRYAASEVLEYSEGIESHVPIAQRVARAVVQFR